MLRAAPVTPERCIWNRFDFEAKVSIRVGSFRSTIRRRTGNLSPDAL
jgi:hypothetical protein